MKNLIMLISIVGLLLFAACENGKKDNAEGTEKVEKKVEFPETRTLNPFDIDADDPVSPLNLQEEVKAWEEAWNEKEISVIAWFGGGVSGGEIRRFSNSDNPGLIVLKTSLPAEELQKMAQFAGAQHIVLKGKVRDDGSSIFLDESMIVDAFEGEVPSGQQLNPNELDANTPVNAVDVLNSMKAWNGAEVTVKGMCDVPMTGNAYSFRTDDGSQRLVIAVFDEKFEGKTPEKVVKTVKGKVNYIRDTGEISLAGSVFVE